MDLDVLGLRGFGDENVGEDHRYSEEDDNDDQTLSQPALGFAHPRNKAVFLFLSILRRAPMVLMV